MTALAAEKVLDWSTSQWQRAWWSDMPLSYFVFYRTVVFGWALYLLLSRSFGHLAGMPDFLFDESYETHWFSTMMWMRPYSEVVDAVYVLTIGSAVVGIAGGILPIAAAVCGTGIFVLDNWQTLTTTSDAEVLPYAMAMWVLVLGDRRYHLT